MVSQKGKVHGGSPYQFPTWGLASYLFDLLHLGVNRREGNDVYVDGCPTSGGEPTPRGTSHAQDAWGIYGARCFGEVCRFEGDDNETQW
jgi:hypothetical protein